MDIQRSFFLAEALNIEFDVPVFILMVVCIFLSAFFSMAETAF